MLSVYEEIKHPNQESGGDDNARRATYLLPNGPEPGSFTDSRFVKWFVNFDENKLRPFLIRNYTFENMVLQEAINEMITKDFDDNNPEEL